MLALLAKNIAAIRANIFPSDNSLVHITWMQSKAIKKCLIFSLSDNILLLRWNCSIQLNHQDYAALHWLACDHILINTFQCTKSRDQTFQPHLRRLHLLCHQSTHPEQKKMISMKLLANKSVYIMGHHICIGNYFFVANRLELRLDTFGLMNPPQPNL